MEALGGFTPHHSGNNMIPKNFPIMTGEPKFTDALSWYDRADPTVQKMFFEARGGEIVPLFYDHPDNPNIVGVSRTLAPISQNDNRATGGFEFEAQFTSDLRPEQEPFVEGVFKELEENQGCIGEAPTGFGKTTVGCKLICEIGRPTCVIIPQGNLDWKPELLKHTTLTEDDIGIWQGQGLPDPKAKVVIAMLQSVYRDGIYPPEVYDRFACVIFDEVHMLGSLEFSRAIRKFPAMFRLGLSATTDRRDGKMNLIHSHVGWRHVVGYTDAEDPRYYVIDSTWTEPRRQDGKPILFDPSRTNQATRSLMADPIRNAAIANAVLRAHKAARRTIVFISQIKHGERIRKALIASGVPKNLIIEYNGSISKFDEARAKACPAGVVLIATYKYCAMGVNIPALDTCVLAFPRLDVRQPVGRILRKLVGKQIPIVLDVWDNLCPTLAHIAKKRWQIMMKNGAIWKGPFS